MIHQDYAAGMKVLHWVLAALIIFMLYLGWTMGGIENLVERIQAYNLHKSLGITILALMVLRVLWRAVTPTPPEPATMSGMEKLGAALGHLALYGLIFLIAVSGWALISTSDKPSLLFGQPFPLLPWFVDLGPDEKKSIHQTLAAVHEFAAFGLAAMIGLHVLATIWHAVRGDGIWSRMAPRFPGRGAAVALAVTAAGSVALLGASDARATEWSVDPQKSAIAFEATGSGFVTKGTFKAFRSEVEFDPAMPEQTSVRVLIDVRSVSTGQGDVDQALLSPDFFDPARFPTAEFVARSAKPAGKGKYVLEGRLTMKGVAKPVSLPFSIATSNGAASVKGETVIDRLEFGVGPQTVAGYAVEKDVKLSIDLAALKLTN
ncbi:YceI family protein [Rhodomicrobium sp. Az07]|uniref:YceI family protein n=1 Tax=Rhodomicrobium sp. Az07 TaxID=2839034 RepID=UPI001BE6868F|nr:YceI family protein [Rhodomicrobium sp. Az07]MBT3071913.1 YceI family protein [Rhodomicrobium sp. Az07]